MCGAAKTLSIAARTRAGRGSGRIGRWRKRATTRSRASCLSTCRLLTRIKCAAAAAAARSAAIDARRPPLTSDGSSRAQLFFRGVGKQHWATLDRGGKYIPLEPAFTIKEVKIHPTEPEWMMASHLTEGCKGAERKECNMEVYLTQGALLHHTCTRAAAAARWGHRRCSPMRRATWPRAAPQPRMPTGCSARRPLTALGSASSAAACCWAGRSPRRPSGPALTTARAALSRPRQDLEADPALRGSIRVGTRGRRAAQIGDAQRVDLHGHVSNELGQPAVWRVERQGAGTLIATDDLPCMHWRVERQGAGTLIATDDLPCMPVLTTTLSTRSGAIQLRQR